MRPQSRVAPFGTFWVEVSAENEVRDRSAGLQAPNQWSNPTAGAVAEARPRELPRLGAGCSEGAPRDDSSKEGGCQGDDASSAAAAVSSHT